MNLTNQVVPSKEAFVKFIKEYPSNTPITMINVLKFKEKSGRGTESGKQAYLKYSKNMEPLMKAAEAKVVWMGNLTHTLIGDYETQADMVIIVSYPSKDHFLAMTSTPEYEEISKDRKVALEYGGLMASTTIG